MKVLCWRVLRATVPRNIEARDTETWGLLLEIIPEMMRVEDNLYCRVLRRVSS